MRARITKRLVDGLKPAATDYYVFDTDTIGFAVRVRMTGGENWRKHGVSVIDKIRASQPVDYVKIIAAVVGRDANGGVNLSIHTAPDVRPLP
jgi:hypothetical protein